MARILFASLIVLHGCLHIIGVAGGNVTKTRRSERFFAGSGIVNLLETRAGIIPTLWLLAVILFFATAMLYLLRWHGYWVVAVTAITVSQTLICLHWRDAKYGTVPNIVILLLVIATAPALRFERSVQREVGELSSAANPNTSVITENNIATLPSSVQRWLRRSNVINKALPNIIYITQRGKMRTDAGHSWMSFTADQYFSIDPPSFVWSSKISMAPFITIAGRDRFNAGKGNMLIKPLYLFTAANSSGREIDEGTLTRYMAEMVWFPQAATSPYAHWEDAGNDKARLTMTYRDVTASAIYHFTPEGDVAAFEALRYGDFNGVFRKERWVVTMTGYKSFEGILIPNFSEVTWKLREGDFQWLSVEVVEMKHFSSLP